MNEPQYDHSRLQLRGIVPPLVTPLTSTGDFDAPSFGTLIERVIGGGVHGVFVMGSTGEFSSFDSKLRQTVIGESCSRVGKRVPVVVNVSATCLKDSLEFAEYAERSGADAVAICPPFYFSVTQSDLVRYLTKFAQNAALPVFLYNIPQNAHHELTVETVDELADVPNIIGLKNSNGSLDYFRSVCLIKRRRPEFAVLAGTEEILLPAMELGADGSVCGGANMFPELFVKLYRAIAEGRTTQATEIQEQVIRIAQAVYTVGAPETSYLRGLKAALACLGVCEAAVAEPLAPFGPDEMKELTARLNRVSPDLN